MPKSPAHPTYVTVAEGRANKVNLSAEHGPSDLVTYVGADNLIYLVNKDHRGLMRQILDKVLNRLRRQTD